MEINAVAKLVYDEGEGILSYENLSLNVKFKEKGKIFKTSLSETLFTTFYIHNSHLRMPDDQNCKTYEEYYELVNATLEDMDLVKEWAEAMVKDYFNDKSVDDKKESMKKDVTKKVAGLNKINIKVKL